MAKSESSPKISVSDNKTKHECRVCLKYTGNIPIFGSNNMPDISMEILIFGGIQLVIDDEFPKFICEECFKLLQGAIKFRKSAKQAEITLKRRPKSKSNIVTSLSKTRKLEIPKNKEFEEHCLTKLELVSTTPEGTEEDNTVGIKEEQQCNKEFIKEEEFENKNQCYEEFIKEKSENKQQCNKKFINKEESENEQHCNEDSIKKEENKQCNENFLNDPVTHTCLLCTKDFNSLDKYEKHKLTNVHKRNYVLSFLPKRKDLKVSNVKKPDQRDHKCNSLLTKTQFVGHMKSEHKNKVYNCTTTKMKECSICLKLLRFDYVERHKRNVHGVGQETTDEVRKPKDRIECTVCKKLFAQDYYHVHLKRHYMSNQTNYICDKCGKQFAYASALHNHHSIHSTDRPYKCEHCPYRGRTKQFLQIHLLTHTREYPYKCSQCNTKCITKSNLNRHMQRHRGPIDFLCDTCQRGFYSKLELERHISVAHLGIKNHICNICGAAFGYRHGLMKHQRKVHKRKKGEGGAKATYLKLEAEGRLQQLTT